MEAIQILPETGQWPLKGYLPSDLLIENDYYKYSEDGRAVSEDEYWEKYYVHPEFSYEWNNGFLEVKPLTYRDGVALYFWFVKILTNFLELKPNASMFGQEATFTLYGKYGELIRKPDLGVILNSNPVPFKSERRSYSGTCDVCIEILSYSSLREIKRDTVDKKREYEAAGVKEYYILDDRNLETAFYRLNNAGIYEFIRPVKEDIIQSEVLPGFQFRISNLYNQPFLNEMVKDDVYKSFIMTEYQAEKQRAEEADRRAEEADRQAEADRQRAEEAERRAEEDRQRAEVDRQRAEEAERRANSLAAKLKKLGISADNF